MKIKKIMLTMIACASFWGGTVLSNPGDLLAASAIMILYVINGVNNMEAQEKREAELMKHKKEAQKASTAQMLKDADKEKENSDKS